MWNFSARPVQLRMALLISGIILFATAVGVVVVFTHFPGSQANQITGVSNSGNSAQVTNQDAFVPVTEIGPLLQPCLFTFLNSCAKPFAVTKLTAEADPASGVFNPPNTALEPVAIQDLFAVLSSTPNKGLAEYVVPLSKFQMQRFFPEQNPTASGSANLVSAMPAPLVIARVGAIYNLNPRLLLTLTEVLNQGHGPLMSGTNDYSTPYAATESGFMSQLVQVAGQLQSTETKYLGLRQDHQLPTSVTFFDKKYLLNKKTNPESLALADFLANHLPDKKSFETAIYQPVQPMNDDKSGISQSQNFVFFYRLLFGTDPR